MEGPAQTQDLPTPRPCSEPGHASESQSMRVSSWHPGPISAPDMVTACQRVRSSSTDVQCRHGTRMPCVRTGPPCHTADSPLSPGTCSRHPASFPTSHFCLSVLLVPFRCGKSLRNQGTPTSCWTRAWWPLLGSQLDTLLTVCLGDTAHTPPATGLRVPRGRGHRDSVSNEEQPLTEGLPHESLLSISHLTLISSTFLVLCS